MTANPGESTITIERVFDDSREEFFRVVTNKDLIPRWWAGPDYDVRCEEMDVREGGKWRHVQTMPDGTEFAFFSVQDRDGMLQSGMEEGMKKTYENLDKLLTEEQ